MFLAPILLFYPAQTNLLRVTPAMAAGVTDHVWSLEEIAALAEIKAPKKRGPYKKKAA